MYRNICIGDQTERVSGQRWSRCRRQRHLAAGLFDRAQKDFANKRAVYIPFNLKENSEFKEDML
jgi:hypothetical protein